MGLFWNKKQDQQVQVTTQIHNDPPSHVPVSDFQMTITDVFNINDSGRAITGKISYGNIALGDIVWVNGQCAQIIRFENFSRFTGPQDLPNPIIGNLNTLIAGIGSDIGFTVAMLEQVRDSAVNTTSEGVAGEDVSLLIKTTLRKDELVGAKVFKVLLPSGKTA